MKQYLPYLVISIGVGCILIGGYLVRRQHSCPEISQIPRVESKNIPIGTVTVDVAGAVINPGVYELRFDSRVADAISQAGGMTSQADREYIAKNLNLAESLKNADKIYIPFEGENKICQEMGSSSNTIAETNLVSINNATETDLEDLPVIGEKTAIEIIAGRPYGSIDELVKKGILSDKQFSELKKYIVL